MLTKFRLFTIMLVALMLVLAPTASAQNEPVIIRWFVGLGTGINPDQIPPQEQIVADFNASHDNIQIEVTFVDTSAAIDTLSILIASGDAPDIVGPVGVEGSNAFAEAWLDLHPLIESTGYDLTQFDEQSIDFYFIEGEGQVGLPYAVFPSFIIYNTALFDEAGLNYPPTEFGAPYVWSDGTEVEWNIETMTELARLLTVDANGYFATEPEFDPNAVEQFGFHGVFHSARGHASLFGAGNVVDEEGNAVIPDHWRDAWNWYYDGMFGETPFMPTEQIASGDAWGNGNTFASGRVAMSTAHLWYISCCLGDQVTEWNIGAVPSYNGTITAKLHADNFRILEATENPEEAFEVLIYLTDERGADLLQVYGGMPARLSEQEAFFETYAQSYPEDIHWNVVTSALSYADVPSHEGYTPNYTEADTRMNTWGSLYQSTPGLDLDAEMDNLRDDLQQIFAAD